MSQYFFKVQHTVTKLHFGALHLQILILNVTTNISALCVFDFF
jgi:hypothetical protein